jgi:hypothetical protein
MSSHARLASRADFVRPRLPPPVCPYALCPHLGPPHKGEGEVGARLTEPGVSTSDFSGW